MLCLFISPSFSRAPVHQMGIGRKSFEETRVAVPTSLKYFLKIFLAKKLSFLSWSYPFLSISLLCFVKKPFYYKCQTTVWLGTSSHFPPPPPLAFIVAASCSLSFSPPLAVTLFLPLRISSSLSIPNANSNEKKKKRKRLDGISWHG